MFAVIRQTHLVFRRHLQVIDHDELDWNLPTLQVEAKLVFQSLR